MCHRISLSVCMHVCIGLHNVCILYTRCICIVCTSHVGLCIRVCLHACMYVCIHVCMYMSACMYCMHVDYVCMCILCMYVCMYVGYVCICMYACMHACIHACICMYVCMYMYVCVCMHNVTLTCARVCRSYQEKDLIDGTKTIRKSPYKVINVSTDVSDCLCYFVSVVIRYMNVYDWQCV